MDPDTPTPNEWLHRFRERYDESISDPTTELGVFYQRHEHYVNYQAMLDTDRTEYTDEEWVRVLGGFLARLAREFGFYQLPEWNGRPDIAWVHPGQVWRLATLILQSNYADSKVTEVDLPQLVAAHARLAVLVMYPDYPPPPGTDDYDSATEVWVRRVGEALSPRSPAGDFLLLTISTNSWDIPAPWRGFRWDPVARRLEPVPPPSSGARGPEPGPYA